MVETPEDINAQLSQFLSVNGVLNPHTRADDRRLVLQRRRRGGRRRAARAVPGAAPTPSSAGDPPPPWTHADLLSNFFNKSPVPDIGAIWAHYSQWLAQPAGCLPTFTVDRLRDHGGSSKRRRTVAIRRTAACCFTVGCHGGLNVPDTLLGARAAPRARREKRFKDWAQAYGAGAASVYVANTGFGYGDTDVADLSERLYDHFASNINSGGTVGEQWVRALHQYYSEPSNYDVIDEKVMIEANMYGLPFYGFGGTPQHTPPAVHPANPRGRRRRRHGAPAGRQRLQLRQATPAARHSLFVDPAHRTARPSRRRRPWTMGTLSVFYRPAQPDGLARRHRARHESRTASGSAAFTTHTLHGVKPYKPFPLVRSTNDKPVRDFPNIFFPATAATVNRDVTFGAQHDTAVVNLGRFFPNPTGDLTKGTEQVVDSIGLDIGYSTSSDYTPPQILQTSAVQNGTQHHGLRPRRRRRPA